MKVCKSLFVLVFLCGAALAAPRAHSQRTPTNCTASQQAAVECFVANAVATNLTKPRYGMTLAEFESYGVSVSLILRTQRTYVVLVGISSAVADAMPPANADGTPNQTAQDNAIMATISAANRYGFTSPPAGTTLLDLEHFSMDVADTMNNNNGALELLTPGISLRIVDSYIITATSNGQVNWSEVDANLSTVVSKYISSGLIKIPPGMFSYGVTSFVNSLAKIIYDYKVATHRTTLRAN